MGKSSIKLTLITLIVFSLSSLFPAQANKTKSQPASAPSAVVIQGKPTQYTEAISSPQPMLQVRGTHLKKDSYYLVNVQLRVNALYLYKTFECALINAREISNPNFSSALLLGQFSFYPGYTENERTAPPPTENVKQLTGIVMGSGTDLVVVCKPIIFYQRNPGTHSASVIAKAEIISLGKVSFVNE